MDTTALVQAISEARKELTFVKARLTELQQLESKRQILEQFIAVSQDVVRYDVPELTPRPLGEAAPTADLKDEKLWEAAMLVMQLRKKPMSPAEVLEALTKEGFVVHGVHKRESVRSSMIRRDSVFERVSRGMFALCEWPEVLKRSRDNEQISMDE